VGDLPGIGVGDTPLAKRCQDPLRRKDERPASRSFVLGWTTRKESLFVHFDKFTRRFFRINGLGRKSSQPIDFMWFVRIHVTANGLGTIQAVFTYKNCIQYIHFIQPIDILYIQSIQASSILYIQVCRLVPPFPSFPDFKEPIRPLPRCGLARDTNSLPRRRWFTRQHSGCERAWVTAGCDKRDGIQS
jgi:hypothetical protein